MASAIRGTYNRPGSTYLIVLSASMMITVIGLGALLAVRVERRAARITGDSVKARLLADSAVQTGLLLIAQDPNWRTTRPNGTWLSNKSLGAGTFTLQGVDPGDGNLADSDYESLLLTGIGANGAACHKTQVTLVPDIRPLEALSTCLHASGLITVNSDKQIALLGGSLSTNGQLDNQGTVDGSVDAAGVIHTGTIYGTPTIPAPAKRMPASQVISDYISKATVIPFTGTIDSQLLSAGRNPWGAVDPNGFYFLDTGGSDLTIKNSRICGTLIVRTGTKKLTLSDAVLMESFRSDSPVLIVDGNAEFKYTSIADALSEDTCDRNFNPSSTPYQGQWDTDEADEYPNEIRGLVHVKGTLKFSQTARVVGCVICEGAVDCTESNTILHDPALYANPPQGYTFVPAMKIAPAGYKQVVE